jgi:ABC-type antimicrobial peptide transport system permease subunit
MRRSILTTFALCLSVLLVLAVGSAVAKEKAKQGQLNGTVHMINKDTSTITIMKNNAQRQVIYNNDTKWMYGTQAAAKPGSLDQLKEGWYINCKGTFDGVKLVASACRFRESK